MLGKYLTNSIPLGEAADFFIKLKYAGKEVPSLDEVEETKEAAAKDKKPQKLVPSIPELESGDYKKEAGTVTDFLKTQGKKAVSDLKNIPKSHKAFRFAKDEGEAALNMARGAAKSAKRVSPNSEDAKRLRNYGEKMKGMADEFMAKAKAHKSQRNSALLRTGARAGGAMGAAGAAGAVASKATKEKTSQGMGSAPAPLTGTAAGEVPPISGGPSPLTGAAAGQHAKMAARFVKAVTKLAEDGAPPPALQQLEDDGVDVQSGEEEPTPPQVDPELAQYLQQQAEGQAVEEQGMSDFYKQKFEEAAQQLQASQAAADQATQQSAQLQQQLEEAQGQAQATMDQAKQIQNAAMANSQQSHAAAAQAMQQTLAKSTELTNQMQLAANMRDALQGMKEQLMQVATAQPPPATTMEAGTLEATQQPPVNQAGTPEAAPDAGTPLAAATPGESGAEVSPAAGQGQEPAMAGAEPQSMGDQSQQPTPKAAAALTPEQMAGLAGVLGGAALGGAGTAALYRKGSGDDLRKKVELLEKKKSVGDDSFGTDMDLAQAKARLGLGDVARRHPGAAMLTGSLVGAGAGHKMSPVLADLIHAYKGT